MIDDPENDDLDDLEDVESSMKLREWYREQGMKVLSRQEKDYTPSTTVEKGNSVLSASRQQLPKLNLAKAPNGKAKTRIKKRKVSQEPNQIEVDSEDEEDQPTLKRVRLLGKAPTPSGSGSGGRNNPTMTTNKMVSASSSARKPKSATVTSPVRTSRKVEQPMTASATWPKIDKPIFDQVGSFTYAFHHLVAHVLLT